MFWGLYVDVLSVSMRFSVISILSIFVVISTFEGNKTTFFANAPPPHPYPWRQQKSPVGGKLIR